MHYAGSHDIQIPANITSKDGVEDRATNGTSSKNQSFSRMGIYRCETKRYRVLVMNFVDKEAWGVNCIEKQATSYKDQNWRCLQGGTYPSSEKIFEEEK